MYLNLKGIGVGSIEYILINWAGLSEDTLEILRGGEGFGQVAQQLLGKVTELLDSVLKLDSTSIEFLGSAELSAKPETA